MVTAICAIAQTQPGEARPGATPDPEDRSSKTVDAKKIDPETMVELGAAYEFVNNDRPDWQTYYFSINHKFSTGQVLYGMASAVRRFETTDANFMIGLRPAAYRIEALDCDVRSQRQSESSNPADRFILWPGRADLQQRLDRSRGTAALSLSIRHCEHGHLRRRKIFQGVPRSVHVVCRTFEWEGNCIQSRVPGKLLLR